MSLARSDPTVPRARFALDPVHLAVLCLFAAAGAAAFATLLSPHGYRHVGRLLVALLLGAAVSLLLRFGLARLLRRSFAIATRRAGYAATAAALVMLVAAAGARGLVATSGGADGAGTAAQQAFERWQLRAVPLLVRYKDALAADSSSDGGAISVARVERTRRVLVALEPPARRLVQDAPSDLRRFMPLLLQAVRLAAGAQGRYESATAAHGVRSRVLLEQANRLLRRSQQAMAAFSFGVNGVGARLTSG